MNTGKENCQWGERNCHSYDFLSQPRSNLMTDICIPEEVDSDGSREMDLPPKVKGKGKKSRKGQKAKVGYVLFNHLFCDSRKI